MRMMLRWTIPVDRGNEATLDGTLALTIKTMVEVLKPEAAYFWPEKGGRAGMMVFEMADTTHIPIITEPLFMIADAAVEFVPVMSSDDLKEGMKRIVAQAFILEAEL